MDPGTLACEAARSIKRSCAHEHADVSRALFIHGVARRAG